MSALNTITDALVEKEYFFVPKEDLYRKELRNGEYIEVDFDMRDNTVNVTRLNARNVQLHFKSVPLSKHLAAQEVFALI